jgi:hypothetical protein
MQSHTCQRAGRSVPKTRRGCIGGNDARTWSQYAIAQLMMK